MLAPAAQTLLRRATAAGRPAALNAAGGSLLAAASLKAAQFALAPAAPTPDAERAAPEFHFSFAEGEVEHHLQAGWRRGA